MIFVNFYNNYVHLCNHIGKSPSKVAQEIGVAKATVNRWKNGSLPTDATAQKIADYFGITVEELHGIEMSKNEESPTVQMDSEALKEAGYYQLNDDNKKLINQMIVQLIKSQSGD